MDDDALSMVGGAVGSIGGLVGGAALAIYLAQANPNPTQDQKDILPLMLVGFPILGFVGGLVAGAYGLDAIREAASDIKGRLEQRKQRKEQENLEGITRRHFLRNLLGVAGVVAGLSAIPGGYFAYRGVSSHMATKRALSVIDILDKDYTCASLADNLVNPSEMAINPADNKIYFVQCHGSNFGEVTGASEGVYELNQGKVKERFGGAGDPWGQIHITRIAINSQNEMYLYTEVYQGKSIHIFDLTTGKHKEGTGISDRSDGATDNEKNTLKRIRDKGFDLEKHAYSAEYEVNPNPKNLPAKTIPCSFRTIGDPNNLIARVKKGYGIKGLDLDKEGNIYFSIGEDSPTWNRRGKIIRVSKK